MERVYACNTNRLRVVIRIAAFSTTHATSLGPLLHFPLPRYLLEVKMHWFYVQLLGNHDPSHYRINEERQKHVSEEYQYSHKESNEDLLGAFNNCAIKPSQH